MIWIFCTFQEYDTNNDGWISHKEFRIAMEAQKMYKQSTGWLLGEPAPDELAHDVEHFEDYRVFEGFPVRARTLGKAGELRLCEVCLRSKRRCIESARAIRADRSWKRHRRWQWRQKW